MHHISTNKRAKLNQSEFTVHIEYFIKTALTMLVSQASIVTQTSSQHDVTAFRSDSFAFTVEFIR
jgi:hypothetical protein